MAYTLTEFDFFFTAYLRLLASSTNWHIISKVKVFLTHFTMVFSKGIEID